MCLCGAPQRNDRRSHEGRTREEGREGRLRGRAIPVRLPGRARELIPDESEQATIHRIRELHSLGASLRSIAAGLQPKAAGPGGDRSGKPAPWPASSLGSGMKAVAAATLIAGGSLWVDRSDSWPGMSNPFCNPRRIST